MAALLLAIILAWLFDQGSASQRAVIAAAHTSSFQDGTTDSRARLPIILAVIANAAVAALIGGVMASLMQPDARLLFLAIALLLGGSSLLINGLRAPASPSASPDRMHTVRLALRRAGENGSFAIIGVSAFTQLPLLAAFGAAIGGLAALLPAQAMGRRYYRIIPVRVIGLCGGALAIVAALTCAVNAMHLTGA
jgi:putative Ca2+/H+ antiporter (TMEM165/GDT1 family)